VENKPIQNLKVGKFVFLIILLMIFRTECLGQFPESYFNAGIHLGLSISTISNYSEDFKFFDNFFYGKRITGNVGFCLNRHLSERIFIETGLYYSLKGTSYFIYEGNSSTDNQYTFGYMIHYFQSPILLCVESQANSNIVMRYGFTAGYQFSSYGIGGNYGDGNMIVKDFDLEAVVGVRIKPKKSSFFDENYLIVDFCCSILPISKQDGTYFPQSGIDNRIYGDKRNISLGISIQHFFDLDW